MADCKINPSFLRRFDFKLLYASPGIDEYRTMEYSPITGEVLCLPFGNNHLLQSKDWGYTFTKKEGALDILQTQNVVLDARWGVGRYGIFGVDNKLGNIVTLSSAASRQGTSTVIVDSDTLDTTEGFFNAASANQRIGGVAYANGCFTFSAHAESASNVAGSRTRWYNGVFTSFAPNASFIANRFAVTRGQLVYAPGNVGYTTPGGGAAGVYSQSYPITTSIAPTAVLKGNFINATTQIEISDFQDYSEVVSDGAVAMTRNGVIWRSTSLEMTTWVKGGDPELGLTGMSFPHIAAGYGKFNDPVLLSVDPSGTKGLFSVDHGATLQSFDLPPELGQTLPGGVFVPQGVVNGAFPRCYTIKYISDPATNHTKGRWIMCGGLAVWEMIPVYGV